VPVFPYPKLRNPLSEEAVLARLCPPGASAEQIEAAVLARLRQQDLSEDEFAVLLRLLGRPTAGPEAIWELVLQIEFDEVLMRDCRAMRVRAGSENMLPNVEEDYPAVVALLRIGPPAAPRLVGEYVYFFENTQVEAWKDRWATTLVCDRNGNLLETQNPGGRLSIIRRILTHRPEVAQKAVEFASERMREYPERDHLQRAGKTLIHDILAHYPDRDRAKLFPGVTNPE
jgi:hypothetical protein